MTVIDNTTEIVCVYVNCALFRIKAVKKAVLMWQLFRLNDVINILIQLTAALY